jgi:hypothetical protein
MPAHPALRPMAPLVVFAVAEVLEVLVGLVDVDVVREGVDVGLVVPEDG